MRKLIDVRSKLLLFTILPVLLSILVSNPSNAGGGRYDRLLLSAEGRAKLIDLATMEETRKITGIEKYVGDPDPIIRLRCAETIGRVGGADGIPYLARLASDTNEEVSLAAIYSLGLTMESAALAPLGQTLKQGKKKQKLAALEALGITRQKGASLIILEARSSFHSSIRAGVMTALAVLGDSSAAQGCISSIHDPDPDVIAQTAYALGRLGYGGLNHELVELCGHKNLWVVMRASEALGRLRAESAIGPLTLLLTHDNRMIRIKAAEALMRIGNDDAAESLEKVLGSEDAYLKDLALRGIASSRRKKSFDAAVSLLYESSRMVRRSSMEALSLTDPEKARPLLLEIVQKGEVYDRMAALEFLGEIGSEQDLLLLVDTIDKSVNHLEREGAAAGLKRIKEEKFLNLPAGGSGRTALDALLDAAAGDDPVVSAMAVEALGGKRALGRTGRLVEIFRSSNRRVDCDRKLAIINVLEGLAGEGDLEPEARSSITKLLAEAAVREGDPRIAEAAARVAGRYGSNVAYAPARNVSWNRGSYPWGEPALPMGSKIIRITTKKGIIEIELFGDDAPNIVKSVLLLIEEEFYNGLNFHRVVPGFVIQGGCPRGDGWGDAGWFLRSQFNSHRYERGYVGMAHSGKDTPGSQFFITQLPQPHLDGRYTIIGKVIAGMEVVDVIEVGDTFGMEIVE
jgi:cyclophilin family peptidyl-prolyl cis-trans isomerase/HEAT repeat protein